MNSQPPSEDRPDSRDGGEALLTVSSLSKTYGTDGGPVDALHEFSLSVTRGSIVAIVGPSGCGKTTFLRILAGVESATGGDIEFSRPPGHRGSVATLVFQQDGLLPWKRVEDNVALGLQMRGVAKSDRRSRAREALDRFGLGAFASRFPRELSVGMQQRVALLRAFLMETPLLLLDEPFGAVDAQMRRILQEELIREQLRTKATVILVTHDIDEALLVADTVFVMSGRPGRLIDRVTLPWSAGRDRNEAFGSSQMQAARIRIWSQIETSVRTALQVAR